MYTVYNKLMRRCINLAKKSEGKVSPNPLVGCVIFDDDFRIISEGRHEKYGENHAERNAILNAKEDLHGKSLIVNLEPCSHFGKTPPCADLIIEKGIKKVIIGMVDPNPVVSGNGIKKLKNEGVEVIVGILEKECKKLNEIFIKNQIKKQPFVTIKTATTLDGKIATKSGNSKWITDEFSRNEVQKLRNKYDAVLTSSSTVIKDNPSMTCRLKNGRNPVRVVLDTNFSTSPDNKIYNNDGTQVLLFIGENNNKNDKSFNCNVEIIKCPLKDSKIDIEYVLSVLYKKGIMSILVESGAIMNNSFIQYHLADSLIQFIAPKILSDKTGLDFSVGCSRDAISECNSLIIDSTKKLKNDIMITSYFKNK